MISVKFFSLIFLTLFAATMLGCQEPPSRVSEPVTDATEALPPTATTKPTVTTEPTATTSIFERSGLELVWDTQELAFAEKYNAITDWQKNLRFTFQAQERLTTGQPILFRGLVDDILMRDGTTYVRFSADQQDSLMVWAGGPQFIFELECSQSVVDTIVMKFLDTDEGWYDKYAVVAIIDEVVRPMFSLSSSPGMKEDTQIDIDSRPAAIASGNCIDVLFLPSRY